MEIISLKSIAGGGGSKEKTLITITEAEKSAVEKKTNVLYKIIYSNYYTMATTDGNTWNEFYFSNDEKTSHDLSVAFATDTFNASKFDFNKNSFKGLMGNLYIKEDLSLKVPYTDIVDGNRHLLNLPTLPKGYEYPTFMNIMIRKPGGIYTCEHNRHEFYDSDGSLYVDPNIAENVQFDVESLVKVRDAFDSDGNPISITRQVLNQSGTPVVFENGKPKCEIEILSFKYGETIKVNTLLLTDAQGWTYVDKYYDSEGNEHTGHFYKINEIDPVIDLNYLYICKLKDKMELNTDLIVDSMGRLCTIKINESQESLAIKAKEHSVFTDYHYGISGTYEIIVKDNPEITTMVQAHINDNKMYIAGEHCVKDIIIGA